MDVLTLANPHWEALTPETQQAFHLAATLPFLHRYYLAGGTGLALHLGHRLSVDLDFFSAAVDAVGPEERSAMATAFDDPTLSVSHDKDMTFVATWRGVGISFFRLALYPLAQAPCWLKGVPAFAVSAARALAYFADAEAAPMPQMLDRTSWTTMKRFLERQALEAGREHLEDLWSG